MGPWQSLGRISGVAVEVFLAVGAGIGLGLGVDHFVPSISPAGVLVGAGLGFAAAIYVMITGMRAYVSGEEAGTGTKKEE
jgi:F0F1-type ATP synthase assembly protein I